MIIQRIEIIDKLLIVFHSDVGLHLFDTSYLLLVAGKLLFDFFYYALEGFDFLLSFILCHIFGALSFWLGLLFLFGRRRRHLLGFCRLTIFLDSCFYQLNCISECRICIAEVT